MAIDFNTIQQHTNILNWVMQFIPDIKEAIAVLVDMEQGKSLADALNEALKKQPQKPCCVTPCQQG